MKILHRSLLHLACLGIGILPGLSSLAAETLSLTRDGKPMAEVVCLDTLSDSETYAVQELVDYVRQISGATLNIVKVKVPEDLPKAAGIGRVFVGSQTCRMFHPDISQEGLGDEGFVLQSKGKDLIIAGGKLRGTLYGVYTFLEDYLGVRWWSPLDTDIPQKASIEVGPLARRDIPQLQLRDAMYGDWCLGGMAGFKWDARNKLNGMSFNPLKDPAFSFLGSSHYQHFVGYFGHNQNRLLVESGLPIKPEMLALLGNGQRARKQPCSTHPEVIEATTKRIVALYRESPQTPYVNIAHEDNGDFCVCERCAAIDAAEGSHMGQLLFLVNHVAETLEKEFPQGRIMVSAYLWSWEPPKTMRPRHNVLIRLAPIEANPFDPIAGSRDEFNQKCEKVMTDWGAISPHNYVFNYSANFQHYNMPWPNLDAMLTNIDFFVSQKAEGIIIQGSHTSPGSEFYALRVWTLAKKLWNPKLDNAELYKTFIAGYYGPAAPAVEKYINALHAPVRQHLIPRTKIPTQLPLNLTFLTPELVADLEGYAREAEAAAAGQAPYDQRVKHFHMPLWYTLLLRGPDSQTWKVIADRFAPLDHAALAASFTSVAKTYKMQARNDFDRTIAPFLDWLKTYPELVKKQGSVLLVPEARNAPGIKRMLQDWQLSDGGTPAQCRIKDKEASDGWAVSIGSPVWHIRYMFSNSEDMEVGKKYRVHLRVRALNAPVSFKFGASNAGFWGTVPAKEVSQDYKVYSSRVIKGAPGMNFFFAPETRGALLLDCIWITEEQN